MFVGRKAELRALEAELEVVRSGTPRVVLIDGDAGMGKSRLVREFLQGHSDVHVLHASGAEDESVLAYGVIEQLLAVTRSPAAELAQSNEDPLAVGARLVQMLSEIQHGGPVAVFVDDVHWADTPSLRALTFTLRRLQVDSVLAVMTARPGPPHLPEGLQRLVADRGRRIRLVGLSLTELRELAAGLRIPDLSRASLARLREHTGGNPLHARTLLEELDPGLLRRHSGPLPAPRSLQPLVAARVASLGQEARALVQAVAVLGDRCMLDHACRVAQTSNPVGALEEALRLQVLVLEDRGTGREVAFAHPLLRSAVYHDLGPAECSRLHLAVASVVAPPVALEHRAAAALVPEPSVALELVALADQETAQGAWANASSHLLLAAGIHPDAAMRDEWLLRAVEVLLQAGDVSEAVALADDHVAQVSDSPLRRYVLGHCALLQGRYDTAERLLLGAFEGSGAEPAAEVTRRAANALSLLRTMQGLLAEVLVWANRALQAAPGDHADGFAEAALAASVELRPGQVASEDRDQPRLTLGGRVGRGAARCWTGRLALARADLAGAVEATGTRPASVLALLARGYLAETQFRQGDWDDAAVGAELAVSMATDAGQAWLLPILCSIAALVPAARGQWEQAEAMVRIAGRSATRSGDPTSLVYAATAEAFLASCAFDPARALSGLAPLGLAGGAAGTWYEPGVAAWLELYAQALIDVGQLDEAAAAVEHVEAAAASRPHPMAQGVAARLRGALAASQGDVAAAHEAFGAAIRHLAPVPMPFEQALTEYAYGRMLRRAGLRREAAARLQDAGHAFAALSAAPFVDRADRELAASGLAPRARLSPVIALTPQELAVARLAASRRTNKEVAEELIVSVKTVEYHLSHVYAKLGLRSRRELAARLTSLATAIPDPSSGQD